MVNEKYLSIRTSNHNTLCLYGSITMKILYPTTYFFLRPFIKQFFHRIHLIGLDNVPIEGPVLLVANHPNSFLDALVIGTSLTRPTHFLARGDAFKKPLAAKILRSYNMLPVFRVSEGKENIGKNLETFDESQQVLKNQGMILIFGEGLCKNNWDLRPMKKGAARIAFQAWESNSEASRLKVIPVGLTYQNFKGAAKSVVVNFGTTIEKKDVFKSTQFSSFAIDFNDLITKQLSQLAYVNNSLKENSKAHQNLELMWQEAEKTKANVIDLLNKSFDEHQTEKRKPSKPVKWSYLVAFPHYWLMRFITKKLTANSVFYDSVLVGLTFFVMPFYLLTLIFLLFYFI